MRNFTKVETIYRVLLRTQKLRVRRKFVAEEDMELETVHSPEDVYAVLQGIFQTLDDDQEHLVMLVLNVANDITGFKLISSGAQDSTNADPKVIFRNALLLGAHSIIIAHNHPSGRLKPSKHDVAITRDLVEAGRILHIELLDHIIVAHKGYVSIKEEREDLFG